MNVTYLNKTVTIPKFNQQEAAKCSAYHAAGQAVSLYLNNLNKGLPMVLFRIVKANTDVASPTAHYLYATQDQHTARVEGGRFIQSLPPSIAEATKAFTAEQMLYFELAFIADITNLLAGPLAEAKYVAQRDDEIISALGQFEGIGVL